MPRLAAVASLALGLMLTSGDAQAQANYLSERRPGSGFILGGTGVALDTDPTASFLNPARITAPPAGSLFIGRFIDVRLPFVNAFHDPSGRPRDTNLSVDNPNVMGFDIDLLLGGLCYVEDFGTGPPPNPQDRWRLKAKAGHHQMAICVGASESEKLSAVAEQTSSNTLQADGTVDAEWNRRQLGGGWAWNITDRLTVGASAFLAISRYQETVAGSSVLSTPDLRLTQFSLDSRGMSFDLAAHLGAVYRAGDHVTLGVAARLPSIHVLGDWARTVTRAQSDGNFARTSESGTFIAREPARLALGVGVHGDRFLRVQARVRIAAHKAVDRRIVGREEAPQRLQRHEFRVANHMHFRAEAAQFVADRLRHAVVAIEATAPGQHWSRATTPARGGAGPRTGV